jgi:hypothetical protein
MTGDRLLHPIDALRSAVERLRGTLPTRHDDLCCGELARLETAAEGVARAAIQVCRWIRELNRAAIENACDSWHLHERSQHPETAADAPVESSERDRDDQA